MSELIYIDTNIFMDHFDGRVDSVRPLGEFAFQLLKRTLNCEFQIVISALVLQELFYNSYESSIKNLLPDFDAKGKIIQAVILQEDINKTRDICRLRKTHFNDTLHAVVSNRMKAAYFVTRNVKDFVELQDLVKLVFPESL